MPTAQTAPGRLPRPEVFRAGRWDQARGDGCGFAAGGGADDLPPGPALAGLAAGAWTAGLGRLSDDELIGVLRASRRLASWAAAMELACAGDLWRRRTAEEDAGDTAAAGHAGDEIAAALTLTGRAADGVLDLAIALRRLPAASAALAAGDIDLPRAKVIADEVTGLTDGHAAAMDQVIAGTAPGQTTGQLRAAARRAVIAADRPLPAGERNKRCGRHGWNAGTKVPAPPPWRAATCRRSRCLPPTATSPRSPPSSRTPVSRAPWTPCAPRSTSPCSPVRRLPVRPLPVSPLPVRPVSALLPEVRPQVCAAASTSPSRWPPGLAGPAKPRPRRRVRAPGRRRLARPGDTLAGGPGARWCITFTGRWLPGRPRLRPHRATRRPAPDPAGGPAASRSRRRPWKPASCRSRKPAPDRSRHPGP